MFGFPPEILLPWLSGAFLMLATAMNAYMAWRILRKPRRPEGKTLGYMMLATAWWSFFYGLHIIAPSYTMQYVFNIIKYVGAVFVPALWLVVALQYTQHWEVLSRRVKRFIFLLPSLSLAAVLSNPVLHLWWSSVEQVQKTAFFLPDTPVLVLSGSHTPLYYLHTLVSYVYIFTGVIVLWRFQRSSAAIYRTQINLILASVILPTVANIVTQVKSPLPWGLDPFFFTFTAFFLAISITRYRFLELIPIARQYVLEQIPEGVIVLDENDVILDVNQSAAHLLQSTPEALSGKNLLEHIPLAMLRSALQDILALPTEQHITEEIHLSDQEIYLLKGTPLRYRGAPVGRILVLQNITEQVNARKQVEMLYEQAEQERQRMQATLQNAGEGILLLDAEGNMVSGNPIARSLLPYTHAGQFPETLKNAWNEVQKSGSAIKIELSIGQQTFHASIAPVPDFGVVITLHDITPLTELMRLNNELISIISHDLRGPLSSISGYAQMARMDNLSRREYAQIFERIDANARRLANFVSDVLTISRLESGIKPDPSPNPVMMDKIAQYIAEDLEGMARAKGLLMRINVQPHPPFYGDTRLLEQMWRNLIDNAIKYTSAGFVSVSVRTENGVLVAQVADTGRGIPPEALPHIFDKFYRLEREGGKGIGLGLSLVKNIVEQHGGDISVESIPNKGSTFTMRFPLAEPSNNGSG